MSTVLETLNRGNVENFGFVFDATRVRLSDDLPAISVPQFCIYSTDAILQVFPSMEDEKRTTIIEFVDYLSRRTKALTVVPYEGPDWITTQTESEPSNFLLDVGHPEMFVRRTKWPRRIQKELDEVMEDGVFSDSLIRNLTASFSEGLGVNIHDYKESPFRVIETIINIGGLYDVDPRIFTYFTSHILGGGFLGWGREQIPDCAMSGVNKLAQLL